MGEAGWAVPDSVEPGGGGWGGKERAVLTGRVEGARDREAGLSREGGEVRWREGKEKVGGDASKWR